MGHHLRPLPVDTVLIAQALALHNALHLSDVTALAQLAQGGLSAETLESDAFLLGHDITDGDLSSALFDAAAPVGFDPGAVPRCLYGLIETAEAAALRPRVEALDPAHAPLFWIQVWSLGHRVATRP